MDVIFVELKVNLWWLKFVRDEDCGGYGGFVVSFNGGCC